MGEVLVLQVGNNANFIGSHIWNSLGESKKDAQSSKMYHRGKSQFYPRTIFIESPDNLGSLCSLDVAQVNATSVWGGPMQTSVNSRAASASAAIPDPASHGTKYWTDILKPELHSKSICELPKWTSGDNFDSFHKGVIGNSSNDTLTEAFLEHVLDNCRYFAEASDHLSTIEIITEHTGGVSGLTTSLLQALREEFGNGVCIPVWSANDRTVDDTVLKFQGATLMDSIATMQNRITVLDSALFYSKAMEHSSSIVPISLTQILQSIQGTSAGVVTEADRQYNKYISTATAAAAMCTARSYLVAPTTATSVTSTSALHYGQDPTSQIRNFDARMQSSSHTSTAADAAETHIRSAHQWSALATLRGRLPVCFLEATFPGILHNTDLTATSEAEYPGLEQYLVDCFDAKKYALRESARVGLYKVNPFAVSLSPLPQRRGGADEEEEEREPSGRGTASGPEFPYERAFTNLLSVRGTSSEALREALYAQGTALPYRLTSCQLNATPLYVSTSSPFYNASAEEEGGGGDEGDGEGYGEHDSSHGDGSEGAEDRAYAHQTPRGQRDRPSCVELATAVCTSSAVGAYLQQHAALWQAASSVHSLSVQLEKAGMDATECGEVSEQLRDVAGRYAL